MRASKKASVVRESYLNGRFPGNFLRVIPTEASVEVFVEFLKASLKITLTETFFESFVKAFVGDFCKGIFIEFSVKDLEEVNCT